MPCNVMTEAQAINRAVRACKKAASKAASLAQVPCLQNNASKQH